MVVAGIGQCSLDYLALVDSYPEADSKMEAAEWQEQGGGPVATALVALSRLGVSCRFAGVIGDDHEGRVIRQSLLEEGVDGAGLLERPGGRSQAAFIAVERGTGRRTIFWRRPSGPELQADELGEGFLAGAEFLLLDGLMDDVSRFAARKARKLGIPVMLDAGRNRPGTYELARSCDFVVASEEFARDLGLRLDWGSLSREREKIGAKVLTITLGSRGSVSVSADDEFMLPAFAVPAVDTTGAGDVFHGGYTFGLLNGWDLRSTVRFASAMAALKCREIGGRRGIPGLDEVMEFLRRCPPDKSGHSSAFGRLPAT